MSATPDHLSTKRAWDLMSRCVVVVSENDSLSEAAHMLARAGVTGVPVVDESGRCVGVLSNTDFVAPHKLHGELVTDYMTKNPITVLPHATIQELARLMLDERIHRVIVVDTKEHPVGFVSSSDIVAAVVRYGNPRITDLRRTNEIRFTAAQSRIRNHNCNARLQSHSRGWGSAFPP